MRKSPGCVKPNRAKKSNWNVSNGVTTTGEQKETNSYCGKDLIFERVIYTSWIQTTCYGFGRNGRDVSFPKWLVECGHMLYKHETIRLVNQQGYVHRVKGITIVNPNMKMAKIMRKRQASTIRLPWESNFKKLLWIIRHFQFYRTNRWWWPMGRIGSGKRGNPIGACSRAGRPLPGVDFERKGQLSSGERARGMKLRGSRWQPRWWTKLPSWANPIRPGLLV